MADPHDCLTSVRTTVCDLVYSTRPCSLGRHTLTSHIYSLAYSLVLRPEYCKAQQLTTPLTGGFLGGKPPRKRGSRSTRAHNETGHTHK